MSVPALNLSPVVAGLWRLPDWGMDTSALLRWIEHALELGVSSFDHADIYGDYSVEQRFGAALQRAPGLRQRMQLVSKCGIKLVSAARPAHRIKSYDSSRQHIVASVEQSLRALHTDHLDLLLLHRPDLLMHPDDVAETFRQLQAAGKVQHFGVSNHSPSQLAMLHRRFALVTHQFELSPLHMQALADGTLEQATDLDMRPMIWSPLAGGRLLQASDEQAVRVRQALAQCAQRYGVSLPTVAYAWILRHPSRPRVVTGSGRIEALREAVAATQVSLSAEDWYAIWQASMGHEVA